MAVTSWLRIVAKLDAGFQPYYDLTVPEAECYLAEGVVSHNSGKTRAMAEWFHAKALTGRYARGALVAPTPADARDFMIEGDSGLRHVGLPGTRATYEPSKRRLTWPNGFEALVYSAEDPDQIRGPNVGVAWCSEVGAWPKAKAQAAWDNLEFTLRIGDHPQVGIDTTPRRGSQLLKRIQADPGTVITTSSTYANAANLSPSFLEAVRRKYEGTALGRQELLGLDIEEAEGALWRHEWFQRADSWPEEMAYVAVGVDPSGSASGDEVGIVAVGTDVTRTKGWVLADESGHLSPDQWARRAIDLWGRLDADVIAVERNFGGDMCRSTLEKQLQLFRFAPRETGFREATLERLARQRPRIVDVHASRGKRIRAEPVAMLYEQGGRVWHMAGLETLEAELTAWDATDGSPSPGRMDSMVWAFHWCMLDVRGPVRKLKVVGI